MKTIFHSYRILEEVKLPGSTPSHRKGVLYLDFYTPQIMLAIEVHGQQHYEYTPFFHKNKAEFAIAKAKDEDKIEWCELNKIDIVVLKYSDTDEQWRNQIETASEQLADLKAMIDDFKMLVMLDLVISLMMNGR